VSVTQPYFREAMRAADDADVIIVMMHIGATQPEYIMVWADGIHFGCCDGNCGQSVLLWVAQS
jgi:5,10-methenyltetrahydromethanopterin hydrogenase